MEDKDIVEGAMYSVAKPFEFDGESFEVGNEFKLLKIVKNATDISYLSIECKHLLVHGHDAEGLGKEKHCWDIDRNYVINNCESITVNVKTKKDPVVTLKRLSKKEFAEVLKTLV